jgi:hypothetical protein
MSISVETEPVQTSTGPEETHIVCCDDNERSLCGTSVDGVAWADVEKDQATCIVCIDLCVADFCPYTGICRHMPKPS